MSLLAVEELSVTYQSCATAVKAVNRVSFAIAPGEVLALVGESGSGKSSVALALTRLLPSPPAKVSGRVEFHGMELLTASEDQLRSVRGGKISYVFQDPATSLNPVLTIGEQLMEAIMWHAGADCREAKRLAVEWLERVGIASAAARHQAYPHEFSGGMQQRTMLAMAMATRPALLIADEPTTALDVTVQVHILRLIRDLQRTYRVAVLLISHDLMVVQRMADRVGVMAAGSLVELGAAAQVLRAPAHPYTKSLLASQAMMRLPEPDANA